ncbi:putative IS1 encoded protein [Shigella boydii CDC 3083-94]|uniref:IS1 encoded protein n=3 Tax=Shigella boydii TaxID=621 RepID=B2U096_SHIB3|nr:putative IS1 encoded protein [Shigella boydii CDC 3083-94]EGI96542.1 putative transposase [Shigella boydii 3594-74]EIQ34808.1 putative IS1 encoded protein [Shigella boydii 4444-74]EJZ63552.1 putative IS1 encoded protein [Shigella flexneri 1485-80]
MPCFTAMRAEIALMSGSAFAVTHHAFSSGAGRTSDGNGSHASTLKSPSYTKSVSWQHYPQFITYTVNFFNVIGGDNFCKLSFYRPIINISIVIVNHCVHWRD